MLNKGARTPPQVLYAKPNGSLDSPGYIRISRHEPRWLQTGELMPLMYLGSPYLESPATACSFQSIPLPLCPCTATSAPRCPMEWSASQQPCPGVSLSPQHETQASLCHQELSPCSPPHPSSCHGGREGPGRVGRQGEGQVAPPCHSQGLGEQKPLQLGVPRGPEWARET